MRPSRSLLPTLVALTLLAACPDGGGGAQNPRRLWLDAQQEGQMASLSAVEPAPY